MTHGTIVRSGGEQLLKTVTSSGNFGGRPVASGTVVSNHGTQVIQDGVAYGTIVRSGGLVTGVGTISGATVSAGGVLDVFGAAAGNVVSSGGLITDYHIIKRTTISAGGTLVVSSGGTASGSDVLKGGSELVRGQSVSATIEAGGQQVVSETAISAYISNGGVQTVARGGASIATVVLKGARETVTSGGLASATTVSGGVLNIGSGATVTGTKLLSGSEIVAAGGIVKGATTFGTHAALSVQPATGSTLTTSGFKATDSLILRNFAFGAGVTHSFKENAGKTEGVLTIKDGALKVTVDLFGQYVAAGFHLAKSGAGTVVTYTPPAGAHTTLAAVHGT